MGQQQLLLIILSVIIVGIAIAVGINMFQTNAVDSNRQAIISDVMNLGAKAHRYYRTPVSLAGGGQNFQGFHLSTNESTNPNGQFTVAATQPSGTSNVTASTDSITTSATTIYIVASGVEIGEDGTNYVKVYATVSGSAVTTSVLN
jgi:Tfp pilus assembly protein PilE